MSHDILDAGTDVDVETLLDRIRKRIGGGAPLPDKEALNAASPPVAAPPPDATSSPDALLSVTVQLLENFHAGLTFLDEWVREEAERSAETGQLLKGRIDDLSSVLGALTTTVDAVSTRWLGLEQRMRQDLDELSDRVDARIAALESRLNTPGSRPPITAVAGNGSSRSTRLERLTRALPIHWHRPR
jgi:hypothetical protein